MYLLDNELYKEDLKKCAAIDINWEQLAGRSILITGASGLIGSFLIDVLMYKKLDCDIYALGRNVEKARQRFGAYWEDEKFHFLVADINEGLCLDVENIDYIIHAASNTHPLQYSQDPIGTVLTNVIGTRNLLDFAAEHHTRRVAFLSSVEVYGENRGDCERFKEDYCGYIDCNTVRAGYPEGKRAGESLCQAYIKQKQLDIVIPRLARTYGPTMQPSDSKAIAQFIKKGIAREDVVLKSQGTQYYSYCYVADTVSGILYCLIKGDCGAAYNISDTASDVVMKDLAKMIADHAKTQVVFELPDQKESAGYSKATKAVMDGSKLQSMGWNAAYSMKAGLERTVSILRDVW